MQLQVLKEEMEYRIITVYEIAFGCFIASLANAAAGRVGHRVLLRSERIVLLRGFKRMQRLITFFF